jgi:hypothetical protein
MAKKEINCIKVTDLPALPHEVRRIIWLSAMRTSSNFTSFSMNYQEHQSDNSSMPMQNSAKIISMLTTISPKILNTNNTIFINLK